MRTYAQRLLLGLWAAAMLLIGSYLLAPHLVALPAPGEIDPGLRAGIARVLRETEPGRWLALHVLYDSCGCSERVLQHLVGRKALPDVSERVVYVGAQGGPRGPLLGAGFSYEQLDAEGLRSRYHVEAAPLLIVADGGGRVRYVGGYTARKRGPEIRDVDIVRRVQGGEAVAPLPVFGCAVSAALRSALDPLRVTSSRGER